MMRNRILIMICFCVTALFSCDTTPANERDDYNPGNDNQGGEEDVSEEIAADALDNLESSNVLTASLSGVNDTDMSGTVKISSTAENELIVTATLDGLEPSNYNIYLSDKNSCNEIENLRMNQMDNEESIIAEVEVIADGTGRRERKLFKNQDRGYYENRAVVIFNEEGKIVGCGTFKSSVN